MNAFSISRMYPSIQAQLNDVSPKPPLSLVRGSVLRAVKDGWLVAPDALNAFEPSLESPLFAVLAFSCLVEPVPGDAVLLAPAPDPDSWHILAITARQNAAPMKLAFGGDVLLNASGNLDLNGREIRIRGESQLEFEAPRLEAAAAEASFAAQDTRLRTGRLRGLAETISVVADSLTHVVGTWTQKLSRSQRHVLERDETFAGTSLTSAKDLVSIQGRNARLNAEKNIVVNADKIHMG